MGASFHGDTNNGRQTLSTEGMSWGWYHVHDDSEDGNAIGEPLIGSLRMEERNSTRPGGRVVFATLGSWGDVVPSLAIGLGLRERGHRVVLATSECYREKVEALDVEFRAVRPDSDWVADPARMRRRSHPTLGLIRVAREWLLPALRESYEDTAAACEGADLLVSHPLAYAARLVAEKTGVRWVSTMLVPLGFFSAYDTLALPLPAVLSGPFRWLGPRGRSAFLEVGRRTTRFLAKPWYRLRADLGLPPVTEGNPLSDVHSPDLVLAPFSKVLADKQPDWPPQTVITGFPVSPLAGGTGLPSELSRFLDDGPSPVVFTLGTALASDAGRFYETSVAAARSLQLRAVLVGKGLRERFPAGPGVISCDYAPYSQLFPRSAVIVHHGGIGTTGLAMQSGRPMLVVPRAWDQPDNAARVARLGVARVVPPHRFAPARVASELRKLLENAYRERALVVRDQLRGDDGVRTACDTLEGQLARCGTAGGRTR
jgi:rhamnosyltransferase subunit B